MSRPFFVAEEAHDWNAGLSGSLVITTSVTQSFRRPGRSPTTEQGRREPPRSRAAVAFAPLGRVNGGRRDRSRGSSMFPRERVLAASRSTRLRDP